MLVLILTCLGASLDILGMGFLLGSQLLLPRKQILSLYSCIVLGGLISICFYVLIQSTNIDLLLEIVKYAGAIALMLIGGKAILSHNSISESNLLPIGLSIIMDVFCTAIALAASIVNSYVPIGIIVFHCIFLYIGVLLGKQGRNFNARIVSIISGIVLIVFGIVRLFI